MQKHDYGQNKPKFFDQNIFIKHDILGISPLK